MSSDSWLVALKVVEVCALMPVTYAGTCSISSESGYEMKKSFLELSNDSHTACFP